MIAGLGVDAYRFSIAWPRVRPTGSGAWNEKGLAFYDRLVDGMLARNIQPYLTLNHWDLPDELQALGGWANRETVHRFVEYAQGVHARLGDRLVSIATHNEPWIVAQLGYEKGNFAPGVKNRRAAAQASHHLLLSHGMAVQALRSDGCKAKMGLALNLAPIHAATDSAADQAKARMEDGHLVRWYFDPLFKCHYPADVLEELGVDAPHVVPGDMQTIATPIDFIGVNYYSRSVVSAGGIPNPQCSEREVTDMGWEVYPDGLTELLLRLHRDYAVPQFMVTENGGAFKDAMVDGQVHDAQRTSYLSRHIAAVAQAMRQGVPMGGYMVWSLMDNFEWASGYEKRFGLVHVDYATQVRTLKDSALWYCNFLQQQKSLRAQPHVRI